MKICVTGVAGFIGSFVAEKLLKQGFDVVGIDNLNDYYSPALKKDRLARLLDLEQFHFVEMDIADRDAMASLFSKEKFNRVIHLAAQAGVRYSLENPFAYVESNLIGMMTILEGCRHNDVEHLVYASSSSVYGMNEKVPFSTEDNVDNPVSLYAATKKSNELMAHSYSHLYDLPTTGLRFFTVYGPWGRPDMAPFKFTKAIIEGEPIDVYNHGRMQRDFTYIDDIVDGVVNLQAVVPSKGDEAPKGKSSLCRVYNIGNSAPVELEEFIQQIEKATGKKAIKNYMDMQDGDVLRTYADMEPLDKLIGFRPSTPLSNGIHSFVDWYKSYYKVR